MKHLVQDKQVEVFQIWYNEESQRHLDPMATPLFNGNCTKFFEGEVIKDLLVDKKTEKLDFVGAASWRFTHKTFRSVGDLLWQMERTNAAFQVYYPRILPDEEICLPTHPIWLIGELSHPGLWGVADKLLKKLGHNVYFDILTYAMYCNFSVVRKELYVDYRNKMLLPAMDLLTNDPEISELASHPCSYPFYASPERLKEVTGVPYYTFHSFVVERLFPTWCALNKITATWW